MREDIADLRRTVNAGSDDIGVRDTHYSDVRALMATPREPEATSHNPLDESEKRVIEDTLARNGGNKKAAAEELHISLRTLYRKMQDLGIS